MIPGRDPVAAVQAFSLGTGRFLGLSVELTSAKGSRMTGRAVAQAELIQLLFIIHQEAVGERSGSQEL